MMHDKPYHPRAGSARSLGRSRRWVQVWGVVCWLAAGGICYAAGGGIGAASTVVSGDAQRLTQHRRADGSEPALQAQAQAKPAREALIHFSVSPGPLGAAVNAFARQAGIFVSGVAGWTQDQQSQGVQGTYTIAQGFTALLADTGLEAVPLQTTPEKGGVLSGSPPLRQAQGYTLRQQASAPLAERGYFAMDALPEVLVTASSASSVMALEADVRGTITTGTQVGLLGQRSVLETPFSTAGYTTQLMQNQQARSVAEALKFEPTVRNFFPDGSLGEYFNMRGFYMQSQEFAWNGLFGLVSTNRSASELLERVEVLRGPGALLYGMSLGGTVGGVVNLVPKRATDEPLARMTLGAASDALLSSHWDVSRRFGVRQQWGARVNVLKAYGDGAVDGQKENRQLASVALDYRDAGVLLSVDAYSVKESQRGGLPLMTTFASDAIPAPVNAKTNTAQGIYGQSNTKAAAVSWEVDAAGEWVVFGALGTKHQRSEGALNNALGMNALPSGQYTAVDMNVNNHYTTDSGQVGARKQFATGPLAHELTISANAMRQGVGAQSHRSSWESNLYAPTTPLLAPQPGRTGTTAQTTLSSWALADTVSWLDGRYQATLGVRHQRVRTRNANINGQARSSQYDRSALSPSIAVTVRPWNRPVALYANYIQGLSQGGTVTDSAASNFGEVFSPYKSKQIELGLKWQTERWMHTLSLFQIKRPSLIVNPATAHYAPNGQQRNRGVEWTFDGDLPVGIHLLGGVAHLDVVTTKTSAGVLDGKTAAGIPHWQANIGAEWRWPWLQALTLNTNAVHTGSFWANNSNTQHLPGWTRWDAGARYDAQWAGKPVVLRLNVANVLNKRYWAGVWNGYASVGAPRTYRLSMQVDF